ncbi:MAG: hypothetical protein ACE5FQ_00940 [Thiogranum sp.]
MPKGTGFVRAAIFWAIFATLTACGGGGGSDSVTTDSAQQPSGDSVPITGPGVPVVGSAATGYPWTAYVSANDAQSSPPVWSGTIRNQPIESVMGTLLQTHNAILVDHPGESLNLDQLADYFDTVSADAALAHKAAVKLRARAILDTQRQLGNGKRVFWQMDNEINKEPYSTAYGEWRTGGSYSGFQNDPAFIPQYVEYYLAPTAEAIREAEAEYGGDIPIMLGSLGTGNNGNSRNWYRDLLNYTVDGTFAPTLAGKKVADIVEHLSYHYTVGLNNDWQAYLDDFRLNMLSLGSVSGMWSTEEIGRQVADQGKGAIFALSVLGRYLHYWQKHNMLPGSAGVNWWGWFLQPTGVTGTTGGDAMTVLYDFLGDTPLLELENATTSADFGNGDYVTFTYESTDNPDKRVVFIIPAGGKDPASIQLGSLQMQRSGWSGAVQAQLVVFRDTGNSTVPTTTTAQDNDYFIAPVTAENLDNGAVGLLFLTRTP